MSDANPPWWSWLGLASVVLTILAWAARHVFTAAVRNEFAEMHAQNQEKLTALEQRLSNIEGRLQERWRDR